MTMPWWRTESYGVPNAMPHVFEEKSGPKGPALVRAFPDGRTDPGWGLLPGKAGGDGFMPRYLRSEFDPRKVLFGFEKGKWNFAYIMRSLSLVAIDIDGKNGGFDGAKKLGFLPKTMAETSKSGNGYHLIYEVDEPWNPTTGFGLLGDRIGLEQGVDFRATGCIFHHEQQRWNGRQPVMLPDYLKDMLLNRESKIAAATQRVLTITAGGDEMEILMLNEELLSELAKPIPQGKRNNTLFAIGNRMCEAGMPDWEQHVLDKANEVGLDNLEADQLIANIKRRVAATVKP